MSQKNIIIVATTYHLKFKGFYEQFCKYGIKLIQHVNSKDSFEQIATKYDMKKVQAIIKEKTLLAKKGTIEQAKLRHLSLVTHISQLDAMIYFDDGRDPEKYSTTSKVNGYINLNKKTYDPNVFAWDDIFVVITHHKTYHELLPLGLKISAREQVISNYIKKYVHFKEPTQLIHYDIKFKRPVDFDTKPVKDMLFTILSNNTQLGNYKIGNLITQVFNNGVIFRASHTRRTKLFWFPLLNAGIPLTPKSDDAIHELTYMIHDFGHFLIPDLIFTGVNIDPDLEKLNKIIYVLYRMMSEAITIIIADLVFVQGIIKSNTTYKTVKNRQIYPLLDDFKDIYTDLSNYKQVETIIKANVFYTLTGDDSLYKNLLKMESCCQNFTNYKNKYEKIFAADYRWTIHNYHSMVNDNQCFLKWWNDAKQINNRFKLGLQTIDEFRQYIQCDQIKDISPMNLINKIYDAIMFKYIEPCLNRKTIKPLSNTKQLTNAFGRYIMGQLCFFYKYSHINSIEIYRKLVMDYCLDKRKISFTDTDVDILRAFYDEIIEKCKNDNIITEDDAINYKEVYPLVEPYYVSYVNENPNHKLTKICDDLFHPLKKLQQ